MRRANHRHFSFQIARCGLSQGENGVRHCRVGRGYRERSPPDGTTGGEKEERSGRVRLAKNEGEARGESGLLISSTRHRREPGGPDQRRAKGALLVRRRPAAHRTRRRTARWRGEGRRQPLARSSARSRTDRHNIRVHKWEAHAPTHERTQVRP